MYSDDDQETSEEIARITTDNSTVEDENTRYLFVVDWDDQAERNRMANVYDQWNKGDISRPEGTVRIVDGTDQEDLLNELVNRVPADHISCYRLEPVEITEDMIEEESLSYSFDEPNENLEDLVNFVITNRRGRLRSPMEATYEINSQKGRVEVQYETNETNDEVTIHLEGNSEPVRHMKKFFEQDLKLIQETDGEITADQLPERV